MLTSLNMGFSWQYFTSSPAVFTPRTKMKKIFTTLTSNQMTYYSDLNKMCVTRTYNFLQYIHLESSAWMYHPPSQMVDLNSSMMIDTGKKLFTWVIGSCRTPNRLNLQVFMWPAILGQWLCAPILTTCDKLNRLIVGQSTPAIVIFLIPASQK